METLDKIIYQHKEQLISSLQELIRIKSVGGEAEKDMPFGKEVDHALKYVLQLAKSFGLKTFYHEKGYYGYIEMGDGKELVGIIAHLDVVPVEQPETWSYPPFDGVIVNNRIYGRGAIDDKGPLLATLYAMKAVQEAKLPLNKRIRLILGTNEETGWKDIEEYLKQEEVPHYGFSPDSDFPLINAEKGLLQLKLISEEKANFFLKGGTALNSVPDHCSYQGDGMKEVITLADTSKNLYRFEDSTFTLIGKSSHSERPWEGINAIVKTCTLLSKTKTSSPILDFIVKEIGDDVYAKRIFGNYYDEVSGKLTCNVAKVQIDKATQELYLDIRIPISKEKQEVLSLLEEKTSKYGLKVEILEYLPPLYVSEEEAFLQTLRRVYEEVTQQNSTPLSTGGATYARAFRNFIAFGALFPGEEKMAHKVNEYINIDSLIKASLIYAKAIASLGE